MEGWTAAYHAAGIRPRGGASDGAAPRMWAKQEHNPALGLGDGGTVHAAGRETATGSN